MGGTKKKIRSKANSKSPTKEYYQIWNASTSPSPEAEPKDLEAACGMDFSAEPIAPPLPPRTLHRPLERSHALSSTFTPPAVHRQNKPKKIQKLEDTFVFDLIDTDEDYKSFSTASTASSLSDTDVMSTPCHKMKAALIENGKKLIGCDNYITTVLSKSKILDSSSPHANAHLTVENKDSQSSISTQSSGSVDVVDGDINSDLTNKPHKPLSRQKPEAEIIFNIAKNPGYKSSQIERFVQSMSVAGLSNLPVCPPTPTHHSRKSRTPELRPPTLKSTEPPDFPLDGQEVIPAPDVKQADIRPLDTLDGWCGTSSQTEASESPRISLIAMSELRNIDKDVARPSVRARNEVNGEASGGVPLPLQRLSTTRLPSIPERTWEARMDSHGRVFYIDHATRTTSWTRPGGNSSTSPSGVGAEQHRRQLDRRYQSIRRTISSNRDALALYNRNPTLKHMIVRIRRDPNVFDKYQHNKELVALVNMFADPSQELPSGWDTKKDRNAKAPVPPPRPTTATTFVTTSAAPDVPVAYNDKVVAFLRQPNIFDILRERHPPIGNSSSLRDKVNAVRVDGTTALDRLSHDVHLTILLR
ncbi:hypothetical protein NQ314_008735 [Rhamnusium bicolor]|uniref:WW domain-containing protein n=1 Tax=Rhamnusium bicolor TaxID=1586634 RepID=A0AAV8Y620_9CUCU|nr:hypothetical protein NQ314_008735 [Rhamnusium bicolor]